MRWRLASTCLLCGWLGASALVSATPAPRRPAPAVRWQLPVPGWGEPAADDSAAYFLTRTHEVVSVDAATGSIRWRSQTGGAGDLPTGTQVRLAPVRVLVGDGGIVAFDRVSGRRVWRFEAPDGDDPGVFLGAADADLVVAGSPMGRLYAVDAVSGVVRWTRDIAAGDRRVVFAPVQAGPLIVASFTTFDGPLSGGLVGFDRTGRRQWTHRFDAGAGAAGPPLVLGDAVAVARTDGHIEVVRRRVGPPRVGARSERVVARRRGGTRHPCARLARRPARRDVAERSHPRLRRPQSPAALGVRRQPRGRRRVEGPRPRRPALRPVLRRVPRRARSCGPGRSGGGPATPANRSTGHRLRPRHRSSRRRPRRSGPSTSTGSGWLRAWSTATRPLKGPDTRCLSSTCGANHPG